MLHVKNRFRALHAPLALVVAACVPIQSRRADTVLHYHQTYNLTALAHAANAADRGFAVRLIRAVVGEPNYCQMECDTRERAIASLFRRDSDWRVQGLATAVVVPSPWSTDRFYIEANGRYNVYSGVADNRLIATSDFEVQAQSVHDFNTLLARRTKDNLGWVDLQVGQVVVREADPQNPRFAYESTLVLRMYVEILDRKGVFVIADRPHELGVLVDGGKAAYSIGCLSFDGPMDGRKIFDVRGRDGRLLKDDYAGMLTAAGYEEHEDAFSPQWYGPRCREVSLLSKTRPGNAWITDDDGSHFDALFPVAPTCPAPDGHEQCPTPRPTAADR